MSEVARLHYVYAHCRATDGTPFYIGKGKDRRAWSRSGRNRRWHFIAAKHGFVTSIVRQALPEGCALSLERIVIAANRHLSLANYVDGGGGTSGWKHSPETKARIAASGKGRRLNGNQLAALAKSNAERVFSPETIRRMSAAARNRTDDRSISAETRAKIAASHIGIRPSAETLRKMSLSKIGKAVGRDSPTYDHTIRHWRNVDGREFVGTSGDLIRNFSLGSSCVSTVIHGRQKTVKGWRLI